MNTPRTPQHPDSRLGVRRAAGLCMLWIILGEALIMATLPVLLPGVGGWLEVAIDALVLGLLCTPAIWFTIVAPAQRARRRTALLAESVLSSTPDAVITMNRDGAICSVNVQACEQFGYTREELIGSPVATLMDEPHASEYGAYVERYLLTGISKIIGLPMGKRPRLVARRKDGSHFPLDLSVNEVRVDGQIYFTGVLHDLTELDAARRRAEAGSRAKSAFLANMSYEIRTPLNGILGFVDLMLDDAPKPEHREYLHIVHSSGQTLLRVLNDILDYSRIEAGRLQLEEIPFDLRNVLESTADTFAARAHEKALEFLCSPGFPDSLWVIGDPVRIQQILSNFLSNAIKFTSAGDVELAASAEVVEDKVHLRISVRDSGIGIPEDRMDLLFRDFSQVDASTTREFGGTGLGLAISRRLAQSMGGDLEVTSVPGEGSTFALILELPSSAEVGAIPANAAEGIEGGRVLVVDDHPANLRLVRDMLEHVGCEVVCCLSAEEALLELQHESTEARPFHFILLDAMMPVVDGLTLAREIRAKGLERGQHVLLLSSLGDEDLSEEEAGLFDAILHKPIKKSTLLSRMLSCAGVAAPSVSAPNLGEGAHQRLVGLHLLLAEDNIVNQRIATLTLEREGARVTTALDGLEVLDAWREHDFDLILMDLHMPEMDGLTATHTIRSDSSECGRIPILAMTACAMEEERQACLDAGMNGHVAKPFKIDALVHAINECLAQAAESADRPAT